MLQEKILDELGNEMDSTSNRLDFVQVSFRFSILLSDFNIAGNKDMNGKDLNVDVCLFVYDVRLFVYDFRKEWQW